MKLKLACDDKKEFLIEEESYFKQMDYIIAFIEEKTPDIVVFPEMSYSLRYEEKLLKLSQNKLMVFGSVYDEGKNMMIIFYNQTKITLSKCYLLLDNTQLYNTRHNLKQ